MRGLHTLPEKLRRILCNSFNLYFLSSRIKQKHVSSGFGVAPPARAHPPGAGHHHTQPARHDDPWSPQCNNQPRRAQRPQPQRPQHLRQHWRRRLVPSAPLTAAHGQKYQQRYSIALRFHISFIWKLGFEPALYIFS